MGKKETETKESICKNVALFTEHYLLIAPLVKLALEGEIRRQQREETCAVEPEASEPSPRPVCATEEEANQPLRKRPRA